jgi:16S rRNA U516 pseudouridylate synthase RsuA-like enzyme
MSATTFDEEKFNMEVRKFLKKVGVTSQRELERVIREGLASGKLKGGEQLRTQMTLEIPDLDVAFKIDGDIALS